MALSALQTRLRAASQTTVVAAALVYLGMRAVSAVVILLAQRQQPGLTHLSSTPYLGMTMHWDALWFRRIATSGYPHHLPHSLRLLHRRTLLRERIQVDRYLLHFRPPHHDRLVERHDIRRDHLLLQQLAGRPAPIAQNAWAFYPVFPFITRAVMLVTTAGFAVAASVVNLAAGVVAATGIARVLEPRIPRGPTIAVVAVWAAVPMAPTLQLAYSEALAMALLTLALLWLVREHWGRAAVAGLLLGLTRPIVLPLVVVYGVAVLRRLRRRTTEPLSSAEWTRMAAGLVVTVGSAAAWPLIAWSATGVPGAYLSSEDAWHRGDAAPFAGLESLRIHIDHGYPLWSRVGIGAAIAVAVLLTIAAARSPRLDPLLVTWCAAYLAYDLAVGNMRADELRMLLPLFPLVAVACGVASARLSPVWRQRAWLLAGLGIAGQYAWVMLFVRILPGMRHPS